MGRRAADLTAVPVLGVPALGGVHGWKTTGGERVGGVLLQPWGLHCSVGVQTSPGIGRPLTQPNTELTDTVPTQEILLQADSNGERGAIVKQRSVEWKNKKEVTFRVEAAEAAEDVAGSPWDSETQCYARAITTNPHSAGNLMNERHQLKPNVRYTNGSVVDSEAIGGISIDNGDEVEAVMGGASQSRLKGHIAEESGRAKPLSVARPFSMQRTICSQCGGRQIVASGAATGKSPTTDVHPEGTSLNSSITSLSITTNVLTPPTETHRDPKQSHDRRPDLSPSLLYLTNTPHPLCPVHSVNGHPRSPLVTPSHTHTARDATSTPLTALSHTKTITVTTATIEPRQDDPSVTIQSEVSRILRPTSLTLPPPTATAPKLNNPHPNSYPPHPKTPHCVTTRGKPENTAHNTTTAFHPSKISPPPKPAHTPPKNTPHIPSDATQNSRVTPKCPNSSQTMNILDRTNKSNTPTAAPLTPPDPVHKPQANPSLEMKGTSPLKPDAAMHSTTFPTAAGASHTTTPNTLVSTFLPQSTAPRHNTTTTPANARHTTTKPVSAQTLNSSNSTAVTTVAKPSKTQYAAQLSPSQSTTPKLLHLNANTYTITAPHYTPMFSSALYNMMPLRTPTSVKHSPPTSTPSASPLTGNAPNIYLSCTSPSHDANVLNCDDASHTYKPSNTQTTTNIKYGSDFCTAFPRQHHTPTTTLVTLSESLVMSQNHHGKGTDVSNTSKNDQHHISDRSHTNIQHSVTTATIPTGQHINYTNTHKIQPFLNITSNTESCTAPNTDTGDSNDKLVVHGSNSNLQVTQLQKYISIMKSRDTWLQGRINTQNHGYTDTEHEGIHSANPRLRAAEETLSISANIHLESNVDKQTHTDYSTPSVIAQRSCEPVIVSWANTTPHVNSVNTSSGHQNSTEQSPFGTDGELRRSTDPMRNSISRNSVLHNSVSPAPRIHLASIPQLRSNETPLHLCLEDTDLAHSHPAAPRIHLASIPQLRPNEMPLHLCLEDTDPAHSHPADAALLLPPSPQCSRSAALQQKLQMVETSLAANKNRITTLLNIIHELEMCHAPSDSRRCIKTGPELKSCSSCQKTACIVYSVEYDFRQQEKRFLEVLNHPASEKNALLLPTSQPYNRTRLRDALIKNITRSKVKSKKLCKTLFRWLPRKLQQM